MPIQVGNGEMPRKTSQGNPTAGAAAPQEPPSPTYVKTDQSCQYATKRGTLSLRAQHTPPRQPLWAAAASLPVVGWGRREVQHSEVDPHHSPPPRPGALLRCPLS